MTPGQNYYDYISAFLSLSNQSSILASIYMPSLWVGADNLGATCGLLSKSGLLKVYISDLKAVLK